MKSWLLALAFLVSSMATAQTTSTKSALVNFLKQQGLDKREFVFEYRETKDSIYITTSSDKVSRSLQQFKAKPVKVTQLAAISWALVNVSVANIRSQPKHSAELSTQALMGHPVKVYRKQGDWYLIQTANQYIGWVDAYGIQLVSDQAFDTWQRAKRFIVTLPTIETKYNDVPVTDLAFGNILVKENDGKLTLPDGRQIEHVEHLSPLSTFDNTLNIDKLTQRAMVQLGKPYLWGGTSSKGMDCSGFTSTVFLDNGILLRRDASLQVQEGKEIALKDIQKGDLIFWGDPSRGKVTHVGIYLSDQQFIHASGRVRISSLDPKAKNYEPDRTMTNIRRIDHDYLAKHRLSRIATHPWYFKNK